jgi:hypothetical protein
MMAYATKVDGFDRCGYWSATENQNMETLALHVKFCCGVSCSYEKIVVLKVRCVRGEENNFTDLEWGKVAPNYLDWYTAVEWCKGQNEEEE